MSRCRFSSASAMNLSEALDIFSCSNLSICPPSKYVRNHFFQITEIFNFAETWWKIVCPSLRHDRRYFCKRTYDNNVVVDIFVINSPRLWRFRLALYYGCIFFFNLHKIFWLIVLLIGENFSGFNIHSTGTLFFYKTHRKLILPLYSLFFWIHIIITGKMLKPLRRPSFFFHRPFSPEKLWKYKETAIGKHYYFLIFSKTGIQKEEYLLTFWIFLSKTGIKKQVINI